MCKQLFRKDNAQRFLTFVGLKMLDVKDAKIAEYIGRGLTTLHRWSMEEPYQAELTRACQYFESRINRSQAAKESMLIELKVDCGIRHLLDKENVSFMAKLSVALELAKADKADLELETVSEKVREALKIASCTIDLDPTVFLEALVDRLD